MRKESLTKPPNFQTSWVNPYMAQKNKSKGFHWWKSSILPTKILDWELHLFKVVQASPWAWIPVFSPWWQTPPKSSVKSNFQRTQTSTTPAFWLAQRETVRNNWKKEQDAKFWSVEKVLKARQTKLKTMKIFMSWSWEITKPKSPKPVHKLKESSLQTNRPWVRWNRNKWSNINKALQEKAKEILIYH